MFDFFPSLTNFQNNKVVSYNPSESEFFFFEA